MRGPGRILDSDEEDFLHDDTWAQAKTELAIEVQKLIEIVYGESPSKSVLGLGVPMRSQTYILGSCRKWMDEAEYKSKRPKFNN